jgi:alkylation response protein AidB-like acyl-CoA dehydrogenase
VWPSFPRELEHANEYPDKLIEQMKQLGIFGLAIPEPCGRRRCAAAAASRHRRG